MNLKQLKKAEDSKYIFAEKDGSVFVTAWFKPESKFKCVATVYDADSENEGVKNKRLQN